MGARFTLLRGNLPAAFGTFWCLHNLHEHRDVALSYLRQCARARENQLNCLKRIGKRREIAISHDVETSETNSQTNYPLTRQRLQLRLSLAQVSQIIQADLLFLFE